MLVGTAKKICRTVDPETRGRVLPSIGRDLGGLVQLGSSENLDLGRPDHVQLIFGRRVSTRTPGPFRTRVITEGVTPSLHVDYKHTRMPPSRTNRAFSRFWCAECEQLYGVPSRRGM